MEREVITLVEPPAGYGSIAPMIVLVGEAPGEVIWPCSRCYQENGRIRMWSHVQGGICFKCKGFGGDVMELAAAQVKAERIMKARVKRADQAEAKRLAKLAARKAKQDALIAEFPALAVLLEDGVASGYRPAREGERADVVDWDGERNVESVFDEGRYGMWLGNIATEFAYEPEKFNAKRAAALAPKIEKAVAEAAAQQAKVEAAAAVEIPSGRVRVRGVVVAVWEREVHHGYGASSQLKMRVETEAGWVGIGTIPSKLWDNGFEGDYRNLRGWTVEFDAAVEAAAEQKPGELPVAWLNRPTKPKAFAPAGA